METVTCNLCGTDVPKDESIQDENYGIICESCYNELVECASCGRHIRMEDAYESIDGPICEDCFDENYIQCSDCGEIVRDSDIITNPAGNPICEDCLNENYTRCIICDELMERDEAYFNEADEPLCRVHYEEFLENDHNEEIYPYHDADIDWDFLGEPKNGRYYGMEMEVTVRNTINKAVDEVRENFNSGEAILMEDGSIGGPGFEIITHPASYEKAMEFADKFGKVRNECKGYYAPNCGGHIHFSREGISELTLAKFMLFFANEQNFIEFVAQREQTEYWKHEKSNCVADKVQNPHHYERYDAVNLGNKETVEVRCFRSNLMPERVKKNIQFLESLIQFSQTHSLQQMKKQNYVKYIKNNRSKYKELADFISA